MSATAVPIDPNVLGVFSLGLWGSTRQGGIKCIHKKNYLLKFAEQISFHKVRKSVKGKKLNLNYHEKK